MDLYKLVVEDNNGNEIESYSQRTNEDFKKWKYFHGMYQLKKISGNLLRSFINGKEQFLNC